MAIALVASTSVVGPGPTPDINSTGANLLIGAVGDYNAFAAGMVSDSKGNTWSTAITTNDGVGRVLLFWCTPTSVGTGHNLTYSASNYPAVAFAAYSGVKTSSPLDQQSTGTGLNPTNPGSVTPSEDGELLVAICEYWNGGAAVTVDSPFTMRQNIAYAAGSNFGIALSDYIETTAAAQNPGFNDAALHGAAVIVTFKKSASGVYSPVMALTASQGSNL